jgi:hypothetical protein
VLLCNGNEYPPVPREQGVNKQKSRDNVHDLVKHIPRDKYSSHICGVLKDKALLLDLNGIYVR